MNKILIIILFLVGFSNCQKSEKIEGHWHLKRNIEQNEKYVTLDLININDSIAHMSKYSFNDTYEIRHYKETRNLITGDCGGYFEYSVSGNNIHLKNVQDYGDYYGSKHLLSRNHKIEDFYNSLLLDLTLAETKKIKNQISFEDEYFMRNLVIGEKNKSEKKSLKSNYYIQNYSKLINLNKIDEWIENIENSTSDKYLAYLRFRIIVDKNFPLSFLFEINEKLKKRGFKSNYLTFLNSSDLESENLFKYINLNKVEFGKKGKLIELIE